MIKSLSLNPFQYRLLDYYIRVCGYYGECRDGIRETAAACNMSIGKASQVRRELADAGYIVLSRGERNLIVVSLNNRGGAR